MKDSGRRKIAVILANMNIEYAYNMLRGIEEEARIHQVDVYIFNANAGMDETLKHNVGEYNIYKLVNYAMFDGVVVFSNLFKGFSVYNSVIETVKAAGVPAISIDAEIEGCHFVGVENYAPMKSIVDHLIEHHGLKKMNFVAGPDFNSDSRERLKAYCDSLREHNLPVEEERIYRGMFTNVYGREAAMKMLENPADMPEAIVCATDSIALGVRAVLSERNIKIPQQVVLTGFDDSFEAKNSVPTLTTVSRNLHLVGHEVMLRMVHMLDGMEVPREERVPATPVYRESCGCCKADEDDLVTLRQKYVDSTEHYEKHLENNLMLVEDLSGCRNFSDMLRRLKKYVEKIECESFYLCLNKDLVEDLMSAETEEADGEFHDKYQTEGFSEAMTVVVAYERGRFVKCDDFPSEQMLPDGIADSVRGHNAYIFSAIHFRDRCMGYVIVNNSDYALSSPLYPNWLINLSGSLESLRKQAHLKSMVERLDKMYVLDSLTGLYNRLGFIRYATESFKRCMGQGDSVMILYADLDGLKTINDQYGHDDGDISIATAAASMKKACVGGEICARVGGDEFVVYAEGYTAVDAMAYCKQLDKMLEQANEELKKPYQVSVSYGYEIVFPEMGDTLDRYIDMADNKMYINKKKKKERLRNNVRIVT